MTNKTPLGFWGTLGFTAVIGPILSVLFLPLAFLRGWVISKLWSWFVAGPFAIHQIGFVEASGLSLLIAFLTYEYTKGNDRTPADWAVLLLTPFMALFGGFLIHLFM